MSTFNDTMDFKASMPANIALIKYIGKQDGNKPLHPTLSLTLPEFVTNVHLTYVPSLAKDIWKMHPKAPKLAYKSIERYLQHLKRIKDSLDFSGSFAVYAYNNFPMGTGLASSASSFSALTQCGLQAIYQIEKIHPSQQMSSNKAALLSREGSGSSARSFFDPWSVASVDHVAEKKFGTMDNVEHVVLLLSTEQKHIASSQAHQLVRTSPVFSERQNNIITRYEAITEALEKAEWKNIYHHAWEDFIEMHRMFHTAKPRFSYCNKKVTKMLEQLKSWWEWHDDGPIVTMDAGPNIHLLFRQDQMLMKKHLLKQLGNVRVLQGRTFAPTTTTTENTHS